MRVLILQKKLLFTRGSDIIVRFPNPLKSVGESDYGVAAFQPIYIEHLKTVQAVQDLPATEFTVAFNLYPRQSNESFVNIKTYLES